MTATERRMEFLFVVAANGPIAAAEEVVELQGLKVRNVEPLWRMNGRQGKRKGRLLWRVWAS